MMNTTLPRYDRAQTYLWNFEHAPQIVEVDIPAVPGTWEFCGLPVDSPLGMPAGPLLNGQWVLYYASLGFDVLTYKTVRSSERACYELPNLVPVETGPLTGAEQQLPETGENSGSWAVSFGMPSMAPDFWRRDIEETRGRLAKEKRLSVSVVGTIQSGWTVDDLADDYAQCARWAVESGADAIETNFSCPNVATCDGQLFQEYASAKRVAARVREVIGETPFLIKIGHVVEADAANALLEAVGPFVDGLAMTNSVATTVRGLNGELHFEGKLRGICGAATRDAGIKQTELFRDAVERQGRSTAIVGVGGAGTADDVLAYLNAGAQSVHIATAAMLDPLVGVEIRRALADRPNHG